MQKVSAQAASLLAVQMHNAKNSKPKALEAMEKLAECYENGIGVEKNPAKAAEVRKEADAMKRQREASPLLDTDPFNRYAEF